MKSERLKKFEKELQDLEQWLKLGLVPKQELKKHEEEIEALRTRISDEKERLYFLKESGEADEYTAPKRGAQKQAYQAEMPTIPDVDQDQDNTEAIDTTDVTEDMTAAEEESIVDFSPEKRWKRGIYNFEE